MNKRYVFMSLLVLVALLAAPGAALAAPAGGPALDEVIFGRDYVVASGQSVQGALILLGGSLTVEDGGQITGDAVVLGGDVDLRGQVGGSAIIAGGSLRQAEGATVRQEAFVLGGSAQIAGEIGSDLIVVGGGANLASTAVVRGDLVTPAGGVTRAAGAQVFGNIVENLRFNPPRRMQTPMPPQIPSPQIFTDRGGRWNLGGDFVWLLFRSFAMATVALLVVLFAQSQMRRVADAVQAQPATAGAYGVLSFIVSIIATIGLAVTLILLPVSLLVPFVLVTAWAFGWISIGQEVGRRLAEAFKAIWSPALEATLGTFALTFATGVVSWLPCVGWLLGAVVGAVGLGAVVLTRFGSQPYTGAVAPVQPAAVPPAKPSAPRKKVARKTSGRRS